MPLMIDGRTGGDRTDAVSVPVIETEDVPGNNADRLRARDLTWYQDIVIGRSVGRGTVKKLTVRYVAWLWGVSRQTVNEAILTVKANVEAIRDVSEIECG